MEAEKKATGDGQSHGDAAHGTGAHHEFKAGEYAIQHITDVVMYGVDKNTGKVVRPYDGHGHLKAEYSGYTPAMMGPVKLEFTQHMLGVAVVASIMFVLAMAVSRAVLAGLKDGKAPQGKLANAVEAVILFVRDELVAPVGGHHLGHYTPIFISYFFFILVANLMGMIPGALGTATGNFGVTLALGGSVYLLVWLLGMINQGPVNYVLHLVPPGTPFWLWPLMFFLELLGPLIKCFVLCVRLFANMIAGHLIIGTVLGLGTIGGQLTVGIAAAMLVIGVPLAIGISMLEVLVCFLQAYVFTLLAIVFIGAAVHPEH